VTTNTIRAGIIGTGWGAAILAPGLVATPDVDIVAICSARKWRAESAAERFGAKFAFDDYRELVAMDDLDLVFVGAPPQFHVEMTTAVIDAGHHVFCTRPIAPSADEARGLRDKAHSRDLVHAMDLGRRYLPNHRYLRDLVKQGFLGELRFVLLTTFVPGLRYFTWLGRRLEGGMLHASPLPHHLDLLRQTFGELRDVDGKKTTLVREKPILSSKYESHYELDRGVEAEVEGTAVVDSEDAVVLSARFDNGALLSLAASGSVHHGRGERLEAYGSDGTLVLEQTGGYEGPERLYAAAAKDAALVELQVPERYEFPAAYRDLSRQNVRAAQYAVLASEVAAVISGTQSEGLYATFDDGIRLLEIDEAVRRADDRPRGSEALVVDQFTAVR
jgi:predicted dehydrogenase